MRYRDIKRLYHEHYNVLRDQYIYVEMTEEENQVVSTYATNLAELRWGEDGFDGTTKEELRNAFFLGGCGETVVGKHLGHKQSELEFDIGKKGNASDYAHGDLSCLGYFGIGVKVSRHGLPPMVIQKEKWKDGRCGNEFICTVYEEDIERDSEKNIKRIKGVWINGFADETIQKTYQDKEMILKPDCPKYKDRAGFYGFDKLRTMSNQKEINAFKAEYKADKNYIENFLKNFLNFLSFSQTSQYVCK